MKKFFIVGIAALTMLTACNKENNTPVDGTEQTWCANVQLTLPSVPKPASQAPADGTTPGAGSEFADGTAAEYNINPDECYFVYYDNLKRRIGAISGNSIQWSSVDGDPSDNVTRKGTITIKSAVKPSYVVCYLNLPQGNLYNAMRQYDLTAMKNAQTIVGLEGTKDAMNNVFARQTGNGGFFMTNSSYVDNNTNLVQEVKVDGMIFTPEEAKEEGFVTPVVEIYMERVVAKATTAIKDDVEPLSTMKATAKDGSTYYKLTTTNSDGIDDSEVEFGVKFLSWGLNATNRSFVPLKKINREWTVDMFTPYLWNAPTYGRSYWAQDGNYLPSDAAQYLTNTDFSGTNVPEGLSLNYYSLNETTNAFGNDIAEYAFENTSDVSLGFPYSSNSHVVFKAQYVDASGAPVTADVYRVGKEIYTKAALKTYIKNVLSRYIINEGVELSENDIHITRNNNNYSDRTDVKAIVSCSNEAIEFEEGVDRTQLQETIFHERICWVYPQGICYYTIPFKHFINLGNQKTGYYGMVRNHWYQVNIINIAEFGHPADLDKPIVPEAIEDDEYILNCNINVLAWGKVNIDASVGDNEGWK